MLHQVPFGGFRNRDDMIGAFHEQRHGAVQKTSNSAAYDVRKQLENQIMHCNHRFTPRRALADVQWHEKVLYAEPVD